MFFLRHRQAGQKLRKIIISPVGLMRVLHNGVKASFRKCKIFLGVIENLCPSRYNENKSFPVTSENWQVDEVVKRS